MSLFDDDADRPVSLFAEHFLLINVDLFKQALSKYYHFDQNYDIKISF
jgi:hypothetical protein